MISSLRDEVERLLEKLPNEIHLDLSEAAARFRREPTLREKVHGLISNHPFRARILDELFGFGPLAPLLDDEAVSEIIVNGPFSIWYEREGRFFQLDDQFHSAFTLSQFIHLICVEARMRLDLDQPFADGTWRGLRVHLAQAPLVNQCHSLCLRRHPVNSWTLAKLIEHGWAQPTEAEILKQMLRDRWNFLVVGPTGSGKTSVLSAILGELSVDERVLIIEDTDEIRAPNIFSSKLLTRIELQGSLRGFDQADLVKQSLRMRPSRLVIGEVRGPEAKDLLLALSTGHTGSLGSLHAHSARQALLRLEMLVQMGSPDWSLDTIRQLIQLSLHAVVVVDMKDGKRMLEGVYKIGSLEKFGFLIERM